MNNAKTSKITKSVTVTIILAAFIAALTCCLAGCGTSSKISVTSNNNDTAVSVEATNKASGQTNTSIKLEKGEDILITGEVMSGSITISAIDENYHATEFEATGTVADVMGIKNAGNYTVKIFAKDATGKLELKASKAESSESGSTKDVVVDLPSNEDAIIGEAANATNVTSTSASEAVENASKLVDDYLGSRIGNSSK